MRFSSPVSVILRWASLIALSNVTAVAFAGQDRIDFDRLSVEQGLSQSIIEQMVQGRKGFMWFATEDGLNRFDGYRFTVYKNVPGNPNSLSNSQVTALHEDRDGILWAGTFASGLNRFDPSTEDVVRYRHHDDDPTSLSADTVRCIFEDRSGRLWIGTQGGGLNRLDRETGTFHHYLMDRVAPAAAGHDDVRAIFEDREGVLWIGTNGGGLDRFDPESGDFTHFMHDPQDPHSLSGDRVFAILEDHTGTLWVGTYGSGLNTFDRATGRFTRYRTDPDDPATLSNGFVKALFEDHEGTLWVGTDGGGLNRFDRDSGTFISYRHDPIDPYSLSTDRVYSVYQDRSRVLWVGTYAGGLCRFDVSRKKFRRYRNDPDDPNSLSNNIVWSFFEDEDGILWIGTDSGGLDRFDRRTGRWRHYLHRPGDPSSLSHNTVRAVIGGRDGVLWIGTNGGGVNRLDRKTGRITQYRHDPDDPNSLGHDQLRSIYQDRSGALWFGTYGGGLDRMDPSTGTFTHYRHDPEDPSSISHDFIRLAVEDREGMLWVGTQGGGLNRLNPETGAFTRYRHDPEDPSSISTDHVFAIHEGRDGTLWFGTFGGGINRFDRETGSFRRYRVEDGLAADSVYAMLEDDDGKLWVSTTKGLSRFDPRTESFTNYDVSDGLQGNEFNGGSAYRSPGGEMFFGGISGFNAFYPGEIGINTEVPIVVITDFQLFNRSITVGETIGGRVLLERPITHTEDIELSYRDNVFTIEFAALHYTTPGKNMYLYRMEGFSDAWIPVGADRRFATFTGLSAGEYLFSVRGANGDGVWNDDPASLRIIVTPPLWETWWFRLMSALLLAAIAVVLVQSRLRGVRMKTELIAAQDAQMAIMPQTTPEVAGFDIFGVCIPAHEVGGDFFDYFWLEGEPRSLCVVVGDVAGKAMSAAMNAVMSDGMVFSRARQGGSVEKIMCNLNSSIHHKVGERMFTALCLVMLDPDTRTLTFSNAGLCEPLHKAAGSVTYLESPGARFPLGVVRAAAYESRTLSLAPGDVVVLFTDGVPEARNRDGDLYGYDAPRELLARLDTSDLEASQIKDAIVDDVYRCCGTDRLSDDMAVVVIKVTGADSAG
jgi:ligand-binding sensor domain-containing protein/serine phosphatase RsbU (regulator of sigma subunit)